MSWVGDDLDDLTKEAIESRGIIGKQETITIKKALWDEMLAAKECIDWIKSSFRSFKHETRENTDSVIEIYKSMLERIEKLEKFMPEILQDFEKRIAKLEALFVSRE